MEPTKGKKSAKVVKGKKISYGATGYKIKPGTAAGDNYCSRSLGIEKKKKTKGVTANTLSRRAWGCVGKKSVKSKVKK
jgi:hypothetical protein